MERIWRYVVRYDDGLAPCVDSNGEFLTLACCKPVIRKHARKDDWIVGFHSSSIGRAMLCYVMRITEEPKAYAEYWRDPRFKNRRDNIYRPGPGNSLIWVPNKERNNLDENDHEDEGNHARDRGGINALISDEFWYFDKRETFSLYNYLDADIVNRLWYRYVGQKFEGLIERDLKNKGDFGSLLEFVQQRCIKDRVQIAKKSSRRIC